jgi:sugar phosphate isomerase/epimerase
VAVKLISKLSILLGINAAGVTQGADQASNAVRGMQRRIGGAAGGVDKLAASQAMATRAAGALSAKLGAMAGQMAAVVAASAAAAISIGKIRESFDSIDKLAKTADKLGETTEALAGFGLAAELTGVGTDAANMSLQRMVRRIAEAKEGGGAAAKALQELGLSSENLATMTPTQAFARIADAMQAVETQSDRVRLAFALFGREGVSLVNTMALGSDGLAKVQAEAERLGITFDRKGAAGVEAANDAMSKMNRSLDGLSGQFAIALAPAVEMVADHLTEFVVQIAPDLVELFTDLQPLILETAKSFTQTAKLALALAKGVASLVERLADLGGSMSGLVPSMRRFQSPLAAVAEYLGLIAPPAEKAQSAVEDMAKALKVAEYLGLIAPPAEKAQSAVEGMAKALKDAAIDADDFPAMDSADEMADALSEARQEADKWQQIGQRLTESVKTPGEQSVDMIAEIEEALSRGVISWDTYRKALDNVAKQVGELAVSTPEMDGGQALAEQIERLDEALASGTISWQAYNRAISGVAGQLDELQAVSVPQGPVAVGAAVRGTTAGAEQIQRSREATTQVMDLARKQAERDQLRNRILDQLLDNMRDVNRKTPANPRPINVREMNI